MSTQVHSWDIKKSRSCVAHKKDNKIVISLLYRAFSTVLHTHDMVWNDGQCCQCVVWSEARSKPSLIYTSDTHNHLFFFNLWIWKSPKPWTISRLTTQPQDTNDEMHGSDVEDDDDDGNKKAVLKNTNEHDGASKEEDKEDHKFNKSLLK